MHIVAEYIVDRPVPCKPSASERGRGMREFLAVSRRYLGLA